MNNLDFYDLGLNDEVLDGLDAMGFHTPTPIQEEAIPAVLDGNDILACAQTGTGKTAAFLLPILDLLTNKEATASIDGLILVPTRELAMQIDQQIMGLAYFCNVSSIPIYGGRDGKSFEQEKKALIKGANIVVATPGRLKAHLQMGYVKTKLLQFLVLDEADRMLDMGFIKDIKDIIGHLPGKRQNLMFSATMAQNIRKFSYSILKNPKQIDLAIAKPAEGILQAKYELEDEKKPMLVRSLLYSQRDKLVLIFSSTKIGCKKVAAELRAAKIAVEEIHSDQSQEKREEVLRQYKNGTLKVLVATDILSRGIDVKGIDLVINVDVPREPADYIHRIGRTARADSKGVAITFVNSKDRRKMEAIEKLMEQKVRLTPLPDEIGGPGRPAARDSRGGGRNFRGGGGGRGRNNNYNKNRPRNNNNSRRNPNKTSTK